MRLFVDQLTNVDFSFLCETRGVVGETWLANIELIGELDEQGMVCDFGIVKKEIRRWFDDELDHKLVVPASSEAYDSKIENDQLELEFRCKAGIIQSNTPEQAIAEIPVKHIEAEAVARWCESQLLELFDDTVKEVKVSFTTEDIDGPFYHYTHGLKKHDGNCQRIAHGHRSKILIWQDNQLASNLMESWAIKWRDIYIATRSDLSKEDDINFYFAYEASQGSFEFSLPKSLCYLIDTDSTVELLADHIATKLKIDSPDKYFQVKAFEGMAKGAIVEK